MLLVQRVLPYWSLPVLRLVEVEDFPLALTLLAFNRLSALVLLSTRACARASPCSLLGPELEFAAPWLDLCALALALVEVEASAFTLPFPAPTEVEVEVEVSAEAPVLRPDLRALALALVELEASAFTSPRAALTELSVADPRSTAPRLRPLTLAPMVLVEPRPRFDMPPLPRCNWAWPLLLLPRLIPS